MYLQFISIMRNLSFDILIGLGCNEVVVFKVWCFFKRHTGLELKKVFGVKVYTNILSLFCQMMLNMLK